MLFVGTLKNQENWDALREDDAMEPSPERPFERKLS